MRMHRLKTLSSNVRGALWMLLGAAGFSGLNALIKGLGASFPAIELVFFRSLFGLLVLVPFIVQGGRDVLRVERPAMHLFRAALGMTAMTLCFVALENLPLAGAITLFFTKPLFMIVLAAVFLGERLSWRRSLATACGFGGVVVMMRPWGGAIEAAALVAVGAAFLMATVIVLIKSMTASERPLTMVVYFSAACTLGSLPATLLVWRTPDAAQLGLLALTGLLGSLSQYFIVRAYHSGEATVVAPIDYSQLIFGGLLGYWVFGELPDSWMVAGGLIVVASSWYLVRSRGET